LKEVVANCLMAFVSTVGAAYRTSLYPGDQGISSAADP
jgi:hypothetical protein